MGFESGPNFWPFQQGSVNGGNQVVSKQWFEFSGGTRFRYLLFWKPRFTDSWFQSPDQKRKLPQMPLLIEDHFGVSLGGVSGKSLDFPECPQVPQKFPGNFLGTSLTKVFTSNPQVFQKFVKLSYKFPGPPQKSLSDFLALPLSGAGYGASSTLASSMARFL